MKGYLAGIGLLLWIVAAWITHVVVCFKTAAWGFLIAGGVIFPCGMGSWYRHLV